LELKETEVEAALVELVMAGLVTNDSLEAMRHIVQRGSPRPEGRKPFSSLEEQLARRRERLGSRAVQTMRKPSRARYKAAKRRVRQRLERKDTSRWVGRWTLVHRFGVLGKAVPLAEQVAQQARQLLARHGVVTRECLADEMGSWEWGLIYQQLRRLEMRGEVRRGYFVQGLPGIQFALPDVVERLRAIRDSGEGVPDVVVMNACDPANLYGPTRDDGPRTVQGEPLAFARVPSTWLVQQRGLPVLVAQDSGARLTVVHGMDEGQIQGALQALLDHLARSMRSVTVEMWNEAPVLESRGRTLLEAVGFYRQYPAMLWERRI
jgi:ATP-dependent Lhr-like helicase